MYQLVSDINVTMFFSRINDVSFPKQINQFNIALLYT